MVMESGTKGAERKAPPEPKDQEVRTVERPEEAVDPRDERHRSRDEGRT